MKSLSKTDTIKWLNSVGVENYNIRDGGTIDVDGDVNLISKGLRAIPVQFGLVSGYFDCGHNILTSLIGAPHSVGNGFSCRHNKLASLIGAPQSVSGSFYCTGNPQLKILPIFKIKGIVRIYHEAQEILNKYYKPDGSGDIIAAQDELIDVGFGDIARMK